MLAVWDIYAEVPRRPGELQRDGRRPVQEWAAGVVEAKVRMFLPVDDCD